ncbi:heavy-metal-associated domain-containing protein [Rhizobium halophytocola]|uniref:Copper chaperone n=1 Tax=Rhizobium halophytocola TaxID=735519 RepID=A0ABS4E5K0_9HYPH|nr:heavy-metal-associated domain-containing protein [Rhizobium halophytocola]MBP1853224.1 copper chaperone [Rhizobium halophytocola]
MSLNTNEKARTDMHEFLVEDMSCGHCEATIRKALTAALPDAEVSIDLAQHRVTVTGDAAVAKAAIADAGYTPEPVR